jgi:CubicO group peptidase (beta-lactamase class C family)
MSLEEAGLCADNEQALYDYLEETNTDAFLLLKDGRIVIESYFGSFTRGTPHVWNSAGKSLMAVVTGIAVGLDSLSLDEPVTDYLGTGWTDCPETEANIQIVHQLTMTTGLSDQIGDGQCTDPECLVCLAEPGQRWAYSNSPYTRIGEVVETAVGQDLNDFIGERIKDITGMTGGFTYFGDNRIFISNARSMARFGLLMLNEGTWAGTPVLTDTSYLQAMTNSSQGLNPSYGYLWWLNGKESYRLPGLQRDFDGPIMGEAPAETFAALGKNGQIVNIVPSEGLVVVRMGGQPGGGVLVPNYYNDSIWVKINALRCPTATDDGVSVNSIDLFPNPAGREVLLRSSENMRKVTIQDHAGRTLKRVDLTGKEASILLADLPPGVLFLSLELENGSRQWRRVVHR